MSFLDGNRLRSLPPEIGQLTNLQLLYLRSNQPSEIGQLSRHSSLDLGSMAIN
jgi:Leucine-rich repeat (LRR) protein